MKHWEYEIAETPRIDEWGELRDHHGDYDSLSDWLDSYGRSGWELIQIYEGKYYFKKLTQE